MAQIGMFARHTARALALATLLGSSCDDAERGVQAVPEPARATDSAVLDSTATNGAAPDRAATDGAATDGAATDGSSVVNCDERDALCKRTRPSCPEGQVAVVVDGCWGDCVQISQCVCHQADDCPERERYVCHMSAQHCGPYVH
ncbi:MAG TPA: hypothetical protein VI299_00185 [Polyangiales bacterium]